MLLEDDCQWIAFDAVGTLIFADPTVHEVYHRVGQRHGSSLTRLEIRQRITDVFLQRNQLQFHATSESNEYEFWRDFVAEVLGDATDRDSFFSELYEWFALPSSWRCYPDVVPTIYALHERGYQLAIASNFDDRLHAVCDELDGLKNISKRVISSEVGWRKPHHEFYRKLIDVCGGDADRILMIGDDPQNDVRGAQQAGLRALLIERRHSDRIEDEEVPSISSLCELLET